MLVTHIGVSLTYFIMIDASIVGLAVRSRNLTMGRVAEGSGGGLCAQGAS
jgi:hypothetical protein